jgi:hypothetical protein
MAIKKKVAVRKREFEMPFKDKDYRDNKSSLWIDATVGERRYGGYESSSYSIDIIKCQNTLKGNSVRILFKYHDNFHQQGGSFQLTEKDARWLAKSVLNAVDSM